MSITEQVEAMESRLRHIHDSVDRMAFVRAVFDHDPDFTIEARDIVRTNILKRIKHLEWT